MSRKIGPALFGVFALACFAGGYLGGSPPEKPGEEPVVVNSAQPPDEAITTGLDSFASPPAPEPSTEATTPGQESVLPEENVTYGDEVPNEEESLR